MKTLLLTGSDTCRIARHVGLDALMDGLIERLSRAVRELDPAIDRVPIRDGFEYDTPAPGLLEWMPSLKIGGKATIKTVGYHPTNPVERGLPTILSTIACYDTATGHLLGLADGTFLTALRTGAASAVASRILAVPHASTLGIIGCGAQAVTQIHALTRVLPIERVLAFDTNPAAAGSLARRVAPFLPPGCSTDLAPVAEVAAAADVLSTCTSVAVGAGPVFADGALKPWLHVNAVGSDFPGKTEVPPSLLERSLVCPDFLDQATKEGECQQLSKAGIGPSLATLVKEERHYHSWRRRTTVFDSTGWALEDQVAMEMLLETAAELRLGTAVEVELIADDPRDPYAAVNAACAPQERGRPKVAAASVWRAAASTSAEGGVSGIAGENA